MTTPFINYLFICLVWTLGTSLLSVALNRGYGPPMPPAKDDVEPLSNGMWFFVFIVHLLISPITTIPSMMLMLGAFITARS